LGGISKLFTMVGDDPLGVTMREQLGNNYKINTKFIEVDNKIPTSTKLTVQVTEKQLRSALSMSTQEDFEGKKEPVVKEIV
jgi:sugar/nucleoside kinase (ribokinase family)